MFRPSSRSSIVSSTSDFCIPTGFHGVVARNISQHLATPRKPMIRELVCVQMPDGVPDSGLIDKAMRVVDTMTIGN